VDAERVLAVLDALERAGVDAWVDGGWGVDALLGRQTRSHDDLDLVVGLDRVAGIREVLGPRGFALAEDRLPVRFVLSHAQIGRIDLHTVTFDAAGGGLQPQPGGGTFRYPPEGFVSGTIANRPVRCISAEVQILCHLGYEPTTKDVQDVLALHRALGAELPRAYRRFLEHGAV
jgi:lincosamide nucleotidyltransferase A/C/D/E